MHKFNELIPTRHSLLSRLKRWDDQDSWKVFFDTYWRLIYSTAVKAGLSDAEAQDVVQETVIAVFKKIPGFDYQRAKGSFKAWLMQLTQWRIADQLRLRESVNTSDPARRAVVGEVAVDDPTLATWEDDWERNFMDVAIERVKMKVDSKLYQVFDLYVFREWPVAKIASAFGMSPGNIYTAKHRISNLIKQEVEQLRVEADQAAEKLIGPNSRREA